MDGRRTALIVASDEFEHPGLSRLQAPMADAEALAGVLGDPEIGGFRVQVVHNAPSHAVQATIEDLFAEGRPDDLLLLHFSGHGLKSDSGELFFAATNTRPDRLASTAVSADFVQRCMRGSRARSIVLFLDCCYGGAFGEGVAVRAAGPANVLDSFPAGKLGGGRGRAVITASSAMEYAFEGSALATDDQKQPSVFTSAVVEGLSSGAADRDEDGLVSLSELYDYVFDQVRARNPNQTPSRDIELQGELYVAKSRRRRVRAVPLPADLRAAVQDTNMYTRLGAVGELRARLASTDPGVALGAREALQDVARSDTSYVAVAAQEALSANQAVAGPFAGPVPGQGSPLAGDIAPATTTAGSSQVPGPPARHAAAESMRPAEPIRAAEPVRADDSIWATEPMRAAEPVTREASAVMRHRVPAGRTLLTGGALMLLSVMLPDFVRDESVYSFRPQLGVVLLCLGVAACGVGTSTLYASAFRARWRWPVVAAAVAAVLTVGLVLDASADLGASDVDLGIWVALAGCLTVLAAGVVALLARRAAPQGTASTGADAPPASTPLARRLGTATLTASGAIVAATFTVRFTGDLQAVVQSDLLWAWLFPGFVGLVAGVLIVRPRRWGHVGPALLVGTATAATWGLWDMPRIWKDAGTANLDTGYFLELAGLVGLVALALRAVALLRAEHDLSLARPEWRALAPPVALGLLAAIPFVRVARLNFEGSASGNAVHDLAMALLVVVVPVLTAMLRPSEVGRVVLVGWSFAAVGTVVDYVRLLRDTGAPLLGVPYVLLALVAFVVIALVVHPGRPVPDPS